MNWPQYCAAPGFCFPDAVDLVGLGACLVGWGVLYLLKWLDPAREAAERIAGKPWWQL